MTEFINLAIDTAFVLYIVVLGGIIVREIGKRRYRKKTIEDMMLTDIALIRMMGERKKT